MTPEERKIFFGLACFLAALAMVVYYFFTTVVF